MIDMPPPYNDNNPPPPPGRLLREIRDDWWNMGRTMLQQQPELRQVRVASHGAPPDYWEYWVVRGPNHTFLQRTMRNYHVERDMPMHL